MTNPLDITCDTCGNSLQIVYHDEGIAIDPCHNCVDEAYSLGWQEALGALLRVNNDGL